MEAQRTSRGQTRRDEGVRSVDYRSRGFQDLPNLPCLLMCQSAPDFQLHVLWHCAPPSCDHIAIAFDAVSDESLGSLCTRSPNVGRVVIVYMWYQSNAITQIREPCKSATARRGMTRELTFGAMASTFAHRPPGWFPSIFLRPAEIGPDIRVPIISPLAFNSTHAESSKLGISTYCTMSSPLKTARG